MFEFEQLAARLATFDGFKRQVKYHRNFFVLLMAFWLVFLIGLVIHILVKWPLWFRPIRASLVEIYFYIDSQASFGNIIMLVLVIYVPIIILIGSIVYIIYHIAATEKNIQKLYESYLREGSLLQTYLTKYKVVTGSGKYRSKNKFYILAGQSDPEFEMNEYMKKIYAYLDGFDKKNRQNYLNNLPGMGLIKRPTDIAATFPFESKSIIGFVTIMRLSKYAIFVPNRYGGITVLNVRKM